MQGKKHFNLIVVLSDGGGKRYINMEMELLLHHPTVSALPLWFPNFYYSTTIIY